MWFNSLEFLVFFAVFIAIWPAVRRWNNSRWVYLTAASFFFYGWWDWRFLFLIIGSGLIDFVAGLCMERFPRRRKMWLVASILGNVGSLAIFKYLDFAIGNANSLLNVFGVDYAIPAAGLVLPVGISFYTFQSMSYTIDIYRERLKPTRNFFHFFAYLSLFPQLVAGPIVRASDLLPQLRKARKTTEKDRWEGFTLIVHGYFKKVVIADNLAPFVNQAFQAAETEASCAYWWVVMVMFSLQIYCDFSGYSDIARGLARWMGYSFPLNFNHPYIAESMRDFWSRWHISLSTWFRDYVYIPLGGSRSDGWRSQGNMWATMLISGLWHGAAWNFVAWGALHAAYLNAERVTRWPERLLRLPGGRHVAVLIVFILATLAWVFFRAQSFTQATAVLGQMFRFGEWNASVVTELIPWEYGLLIGLMIARQIWFHLKLNESRWTAPAGGRLMQPVATAFLLWACVYLRGPGDAFIYFQF